MSKLVSDKNPELEKIKKENHELKMLVAEKELINRVQNELLKKKSLAKTIRLSVAQSCINLGITKSLVLKICEISRRSFYYEPKIEAQKAGRIFSKITQKTTGGYDDNELVIEHIKILLAEPFVDYGYLKVTFLMR